LETGDTISIPMPGDSRKVSTLSLISNLV